MEFFTVLANHQIRLDSSRWKAIMDFSGRSFSCQLQSIYSVLSNPCDIDRPSPHFPFNPIALPACSLTFLHIIYFIHFPPSTSQIVYRATRDITLWVILYRSTEAVEHASAFIVSPLDCVIVPRDFFCLSFFDFFSKPITKKTPTKKKKKKKPYLHCA